MRLLTGLVVAATAFVAMEPLTAMLHRWVMHGRGWSLHRSHHRAAAAAARRQPTRGWEANDWYPVFIAVAVMVAFWLGFQFERLAVLVPIGIGVTLYGLAYALVHDVYIHRRLRWFPAHRKVPVLERLAAAHRVHHERNAAPYGMLVPVVPHRVDPAPTPADLERV